MTKRPEWLSDALPPKGHVFRENGKLWTTSAMIAMVWDVDHNTVEAVLGGDIGTSPFSEEFIEENFSWFMLVIDQGKILGGVRGERWKREMLEEAFANGWLLVHINCLTERGLRYSFPMLKEYLGIEEEQGTGLWKAFDKEQAIIDKRRRYWIDPETGERYNRN
jgi:hypothetical protein